MKIALVHDWLTGMRGGEKCLEAFCELYPDADLFTLVHARGSVSATIENRRVITSRLQHWPRATRWYRYYLPWMPTSIECLDLSDYDLVISSSHCVAKGVIPRPDALHVSYVHTPMRYVWDLRPDYFPLRRPFSPALLGPILNYLRMWDVTSAARVDRFVANSRFVASRIRKYYRRESTVIHPPVDTRGFFETPGPGEFYLIVSALVPYKGLELAVNTFNELGKPLRIIGEGPLGARLRALAGPTIEIAGWVDQQRLTESLAGCRALILPAVEDFGIVPLEANAAGRPVIALGRAGALDTVIPLDGQPHEGAAGPRAPTGIYFDEKTVRSLGDAVSRFEAAEQEFLPEELRKHAAGFDREIFKRRIRELIEATLQAWPRTPWEEPGGDDMPNRTQT